MFGRRTTKETEPESIEESLEPLGGKGRPTPKRKEAEAERKKRLSPPKTRKEQMARQREYSRTRRQKAREAMASGDERALPRRDKGPVRRFVRDFIDSRRGAGEFLLPSLLAILVLSMIPALWAVQMSSMLWILLIIVTTLDSILSMWRLGRELKIRFPDENTKGAKLYGLLRSSQMRFMRMPKPQVKAGQKLPDTYR